MGGRTATDTGDIALADATYVFLRVRNDLSHSVDGWTSFHLAQECTESLRAVGTMALLPDGEAPVELQLSTETGKVQYLLRVGLVDEHWQSLSASKRWKSIYLYATQDRAINWTWSESISGHLSDQ